MCTWGTDKLIYVIQRNNPYIPRGWHLMAVDSCIADYVQCMNALGIITCGCCCGHYQAPPIVLVEPESTSLMVLYEYTYIINEDGLLLHAIPH